jgi:hypothetical protein
LRESVSLREPARVPLACGATVHVPGQLGGAGAPLAETLRVLVIRLRPGA